MPYKEADPQDPQELVGVGFLADAETHLDMAYVFAEEFARLGFSEQRLVHLFRNPFYRSAHQAWRLLGEDRITAIVNEACQVWGNIRVIDREISESPMIQLQVPSNSESER